MQVRRPTHPFEQLPSGELGGDTDDVSRFPTAVQVADDAVDGGVRGTVEIARGEYLHHVGNRVLGQQHAAQRALFSCKIMWWSAVELDRPARTTPGAVNVGQCHDHPP